MHRHCGTNNRAPRWTFTDPCKPEVRPGAREESASPAWLAAPAMNARDTTKVFIQRLETGWLNFLILSLYFYEILPKLVNLQRSYSQLYETPFQWIKAGKTMPIFPLHHPCYGRRLPYWIAWNVAIGCSGRSDEMRNQYIFYSHGISLQWSISKLWQIFSNEYHWSCDEKIDIDFFSTF